MHGKRRRRGALRFDAAGYMMGVNEKPTAWGGAKCAAKDAPHGPPCGPAPAGSPPPACVSAFFVFPAFGIFRDCKSMRHKRRVRGAPRFDAAGYMSEEK